MVLPELPNQETDSYCVTTPTSSNAALMRQNMQFYVEHFAGEHQPTENSLSDNQLDSNTPRASREAQKDDLLFEKQQI